MVNTVVPGSDMACRDVSISLVPCLVEQTHLSGQGDRCLWVEKQRPAHFWHCAYPQDSWQKNCRDLFCFFNTHP